MRRKTINTAPNIRVEKRAGAISILEADRAPGVVAMARAMDEAIARAREVHVGWCAARNITHAGAIGYFARKAAEAGMAGIAMSASGPMMAYYGARAAGVSTNPLAIAVPAKNRAPLVLDISTSTVANGKIINAKDAGIQIPLGWGIDAEGHDTTDPKQVRSLLPLGGPKGSGLSLMIECLTSIAVGNPLIARALLRSEDVPTIRGRTGLLLPSICPCSATSTGSPPRSTGSPMPLPRCRAQAASSISSCPASAATASWRSARRTASRSPRAPGAG